MQTIQPKGYTVQVDFCFWMLSLFWLVKHICLVTSTSYHEMG